jgi:hypothetical protein
VSFNEPQGLFEIFGAMKGLPRVVDKALEIIVVGIVSEGPAAGGVNLDFRVPLIDQAILQVSFFRVGFLGWRMRPWDTSVAANIFRVSVLWDFVESRDIVIGFRCFRRAPM